MNDKRLYSIGEIAEITGTSEKMLRHYDQIGLLEPAQKNEQTKYRYYTKDQMFSVFLIKKLQRIGFSLKEIRELCGSNNTQEYIREIKQRIKDIRKNLVHLERVYKEASLILDKLEFEESRGLYHRAQNNGDGQTIRVELIPTYDVLYSLKRMESYKSTEIPVQRWIDVFKLAENRNLPMAGSIIQSYHTETPMEQLYKNVCDLEVMLPIVQNERQYSDIKKFGGFRAAVLMHTGDYRDLGNARLNLLRWINENSFRLNGNISEEYIISPIDIREQDDYVTKIIAPIE